MTISTGGEVTVNNNGIVLELGAHDPTPSPASTVSVSELISSRAITDSSPLSVFNFSSLTVNLKSDFEEEGSETFSNSPLPFKPRLSLYTIKNDESDVVNESAVFDQSELESGSFIDIVKSLNSATAHKVEVTG